VAVYGELVAVRLELESLLAKWEELA